MSKGLFLHISMVIAISSCSTGRHLIGELKKDNIQDSVVTDSDGNRYRVLQHDRNLIWLADNLKVKVSGSFCYDNEDSSCHRYGRLYTWNEAQAACRSLGEGWRLPTREEWQQLTIEYGKGPKDSLLTQMNAFRALIDSGTSGFNAVLAGSRDLDGKFARIRGHGLYWTITESSPGEAWFANFANGRKALFVQDGGEKSRAFSVRCVKINR